MIYRNSSLYAHIIATVTLISLVIASPLSHSNRASTPRCISGQACFPSPAQLDMFNKSIGGRLSGLRPIEASCYATDPLFNLGNCATYTANFINLTYLAEQPQTYEIPTWETCGPTNSCQVTSLSVPVVGKCGQGNVPIYSVAATSTDDVSKFVAFAAQYKLRFSVKNTGHDYKGRSAGKNSFSLWTHKMKSMAFTPNFTPQGCAASTSHDAVTLGAGAQWGDVYAFAHKYGYMVVGGDANTVGAVGGWVQGGGHSFLTPNYGLGVDNVMEATLVLPNATVITVSQCNHPDIFWAIRGGGGGTFGVVTQMTMKAHKEVPLGTVTLFMEGLSLTQTIKEAIISRFAQIAPDLGNQGFGGSIEMFADAGLFIQGIMPNKTADQVKQAFAPLMNALVNVDPKTSSAYIGAFQFTVTPTWYDYGVQYFGGNRGAGAGVLFASRILEADAFKDPNTVATQLQKASAGGTVAGFFAILAVGGNSTGARAGNDPTVTSVTPAWNTAVWHTLFFQVAVGNVPNSPPSAASYQAVHNSAQVLRDYYPNSGAYQNESDLFETDPRGAFWGMDNYNRLLQIKQQVDPNNLFSVWQGIGWVENGGAKFESSAPDDGPYSCYPTLS